MADIITLLGRIKTAIYGKDVRQSIHDAIQQCYDDATGNPASISAYAKKVDDTVRYVNGLPLFEYIEAGSEDDIGSLIQDSLTQVSTTWSSSKIHGLIGAKPTGETRSLYDILGTSSQTEYKNASVWPSLEAVKQSIGIWPTGETRTIMTIIGMPPVTSWRTKSLYDLIATLWSEIENVHGAIESDKRLKKNIVPSEVGALDTVMRIPIRSFDWIADDVHWDVGVIADELENIDRRFVMPGRLDASGNTRYKSINILYLTVHVLKSVQELKLEIDELKKMRGENNGE